MAIYYDEPGVAYDEAGVAYDGEGGAPLEPEGGYFYRKRKAEPSRDHRAVRRNKRRDVEIVLMLLLGE